MIRNHNGTPLLNQTASEITDAELDCVTGGDKAATTTKGTTKPKGTNTYMVYTLEQVLVSSY